VPAAFIQGVSKFIGVAKIFSEKVHFSSKKVDDLFVVVALKTKAKTTK